MKQVKIENLEGGDAAAASSSSSSSALTPGPPSSDSAPSGNTSARVFTPRIRRLGEREPSREFAIHGNPSFTYPLLTIAKSIDFLEAVQWKIAVRSTEKVKAFPQVVTTLTVLRAWIYDVLLKTTGPSRHFLREFVQQQTVEESGALSGFLERLQSTCMRNIDAAETAYIARSDLLAVMQENYLLCCKREACLQSLLEATQGLLAEWEEAMPEENVLWNYGGFYAVKRMAIFMQETLGKRLGIENIYRYVDSMEAQPSTLVEECLSLAFQNVHDQHNPAVVS